jgi:hypothetical protein
MFAVDFTKTYVGLGSVSFGEESQKAMPELRGSKVLPSGSLPQMRIVRSVLHSCISEVLEVEVTTGRDIVIGRNDYQQNARPK